MSFRPRCQRIVRAAGCYRLRSKRHDGVGAVRAPAPILRTLGAELSGGHHRRVTNSDKRQFAPIEQLRR